MSYFTFNGIKSTDLGLIVNKTPMPPKAEKPYNVVNVPGKIEPTLLEKIERQTIDITIECTIVEDEKLRDIYSALEGAGTLILSNEADKYYTGYVRGLTPQNIALYMGTMSITFTCKPFAYAVNNGMITITQASNLLIGGSVFSEPIIKVYGTGTITLYVNNSVDGFKITGVTDYITIDSAKKLVYKDDTVLVNTTTGYFPLFNCGGYNSISWDGTVTKLEIIKNERWL